MVRAIGYHKTVPRFTSLSKLFWHY
uniref:Uncharacterized protein n=1 Tax=Rhizophora mucronata TaxID=61149 RepID=A0A2P2PZX5_RHIMU